MEASVSLRVSAVAIALSNLAKVADEFVALDRLTLNADERYHRALALMHSSCAAILDCESAGATREEIVAVLAEVRAIHTRSPFVRRLQEWPRGYAGDFETVEYICNGMNMAPDDSLAHTCEAYALSRSIAQQHRNKIHHQSLRIMRTMFAKPGASRVLVMACGSAADIQRILPFIGNVVGELVLNDADEAALEYSRSKLEAIGAHCHFLPGNALRVAKRLERQMRFDLVVAGGLLDYLPEKHVIYLLNTIHDGLLLDGGSLFFTNIASGNPYRPLIEYFGDWFLIERSEEEIRRYCQSAGISPENIAVTRDESGLAYLVDVVR